MAEERNRAIQLLRAWVVPSAVMLAAFALAYVPVACFDYSRYARPGEGPARSLLEILFWPEALDKDVLGTIGQAMPSVLAIAITVVAIIVELASNRYTSQVTDLFIRDKTNLTVIGLLVVSSIQPFWIASSYGLGFAPHTGIVVSLYLSSASILLLIPYFSYVFTFLQPANIIDTIRRNVRLAITSEAVRKIA
ncbi:DUF2254 domain-containing protein, partial [bacterium]|nr:DUF2254 domain-containing protein [bacterium]